MDGSISYSEDAFYSEFLFASSFTFGPLQCLFLFFLSVPRTFCNSALIYDRLYLARIEATDIINFKQVNKKREIDRERDWIEVHGIVIHGRRQAESA